MAQERGNGISTLRSVLDTVATVAIIAVCGTLVWIMVSDRLWPRPSQPAAAGPSGPAPPRPAPLPPPREPVSLVGASVQGDKSAKFAIIEYSDFQCPFCGVFARDTLPEIEKQYVKSGKVLLAFRHHPLVKIHPFALKASEAAECAARQGKFWEMHDRLFKDQKQLDEVSLSERARDIGLNAADFASCLAGQATDKVQQDSAGAIAVDVSGTPTFFIGWVLPDGRVKVSRRLAGALSVAQFQAALDSLLNSTDGAR